MIPLSASRPGQVFQSLWVWINSVSIYFGWWFGTCFIFPHIGNSNPNWLIFFRGLKPPTSIQARIFYSSWPPWVTNVAFGNPCVSLGNSSGMEESFHVYVTLFTWGYPQCFHLWTIEKSMRKSARSWHWSGTYLDLLVVIHWLVCCRVVPRSTVFFHHLPGVVSRHGRTSTAMSEYMPGNATVGIKRSKSNLASKIHLVDIYIFPIDL